MNITHLKSFYENKEYKAALDIVLAEINDIIQKGKLSFLKQKLNALPDEDSFHVVIRVLDHGLMYHYSNLVARFAHKRFDSVQTLAWIADDLMDQGKYLEAANELQKKIEESDMDALSTDKQGRVYFALVRVLIELKQYEEAQEQLRKIESISDQKVIDKWGYFYLHSGDRKKAVEVLKQGLDDKKFGHICYLLLTDALASDGHHQLALEFLNDGERKYPEVPSFLLEKVRRYRDLRKWDSMMETIQIIDSTLPFHIFKKYFTKLTADYFFETEQFSELNNHLEQNKFLKDIPYKQIDKEKEKRKVSIIPIVQKSNYCVPASLEMILGKHGAKMGQDEIAEKIFDVTGSKLSTTVDFWESIGFKCRFFIASLDKVKELINLDIPILLSVDFEQMSHVQVITGFDDRIQSLYIQDPNMLETMIVTYEDYERIYLNTSYMAITGVLTNEAKKLSILSESDDRYFRELHDLAEKIDLDEEGYYKIFFSFLDQHFDILYTPLYVVKHLAHDESKELFDKSRVFLMGKYPEDDSIRLHIAQGLSRYGKLDEAIELLESVKTKTNSPMYHYLKGRIALDQDDYYEAKSEFEASLKLDSDQHITWSYFALANLYSKDLKSALLASEMSLKLHSEEIFGLINHAVILMEAEQFEEAKSILMDLLGKEGGDEAYLWFQIGKTEEGLQRLEAAEKAYLKSKELDSKLPFSYLNLADLYEFAWNDLKRTESILIEGVQASLEADEIYNRLGHFYRVHEQLEKAYESYRRAIELYPEEVFLYLGFGDALKQGGKIDKAKEVLLNAAGRFEGNSEFFVNAGKLLWEIGEEQTANEKEKNLALQTMEKGLLLMRSNFEEALEIYIDIVIRHGYLDRGIQIIEELVEKKPAFKYIFLTYKGIIKDEMNDLSSIELYKESLSLLEDPFTYYRLGEVYYRMEEMEQAREAYLSSLELNPSEARALLRLAELHAMEEDHEQELEYLKRLFSVEPSMLNVEYFLSLCEREDIEAFISQLEKMKGNSPETWRLDSLAYAYGFIGDDEKELKWIEKGLLVDSQNEGLLWHKVKWLTVHESNKEARAILLQLASMDPSNEEYFEKLTQMDYSMGKWLLLGETLKKLNFDKEIASVAFLSVAKSLQQLVLADLEDEQEQGLFKRLFQKVTKGTKQVAKLGVVIDLYEKAIGFDAKNVAAYMEFANFYEETNLNEESINLLEKALQHSDDYEVRYRLAYQHFIFAEESSDPEQHMNRAIELMKMLSQDFPHDVRALLFYSDLLLRGNRIEAADKSTTALISQFANHGDGYAMRARYFSANGKVDESFKTIEEGLKVDPDNTDLYFELSNHYFRKGDAKKALEISRHILSLDEDYLAAEYNVGCGLCLLGHFDEAVKILQEVFEKDESEYFWNMALEDDDLNPIKKELFDQ
ncbi:tetratricopeptide repeat protein [Peribacillus alkalitolerans]|uniref:tetratricopeptide repeat protein n=1 Tax=Peribacillus alkalitolerans TaxID=1550385 RepID=UPI0013D00DD4|nr:tetratricopeptide repeat protein [Peribacillus alkalitolerans]